MEFSVNRAVRTGLPLSAAIKTNSMRTEISQIKKLLATVDGWLTDREGELLYDLARKCPRKGVIVEIGSWKGKSTIWLGRGSKAGNRVKIYAIDPHKGPSHPKKGYEQLTTLEEFQKNLRNAGIEDIVTPIVKTSEQAAREFHRPVALLFVDGAHEYDLARLDFHLWFPKVIDGGIMAFHDTTRSESDGPRKVVEKFVYRSKNFRNVGLVHSVTYAEKVTENSTRDLARNAYALLLKNSYEFGSRLGVPGPMRVLGETLTRLTVGR